MKKHKGDVSGMKKMVGLIALLFIISNWLILVYMIGGWAAAYAWNLEVFIIAPVAVIASLVELVILILRICRKKKVLWNGLFLILTLVMAFPLGIILGISPMTYPTYTYREQAVQVTAPVKSAEYVGGAKHTPHAIWPSECFAYDIVKKPSDIGSTVLSDYGIWEEEVFAPVSGTVIGVETQEPDIIPNTQEYTSALGNYVFIEMDGEKGYMILAHFKKDSIEVEVGEKITEGQFIGLVGNSGTTSEPHLHFQCQKENPFDMIIPTCATGIPIQIKGIEQNMP